MAELTIIKRAKHHELQVSLSEEETELVFNGSTPKEDIHIGYAGNTKHGIYLFPTRKPQHGLTRHLKLLHMKRIPRFGGTGRLWHSRVYLASAEVGAASEYREAMIVETNLDDDLRLVIPPLRENWRAKNVDQIVLRQKGQRLPLPEMPAQKAAVALNAPWVPKPEEQEPKAVVDARPDWIADNAAKLPEQPAAPVVSPPPPPVVVPPPPPQPKLTTDSTMSLPINQSAARDLAHLLDLIAEANSLAAKCKVQFFTTDFHGNSSGHDLITVHRVFRPRAKI